MPTKAGNRRRREIARRKRVEASQAWAAARSAACKDADDREPSGPCAKDESATEAKHSSTRRSVRSSKTEHGDHDVHAPGWDAISAEFSKLYPGQEDAHYGTVIPYLLGGPDPLQGISVFVNEAGGFWHYVSYGMTELYEKESKTKSTSGYGYEFTFKMKLPADGDHSPKKAPTFPMAVMNNLARYTITSGNELAPRATIPLNSPICLEDHTTRLDCVILVKDPSLPRKVKSKNGSFYFLEIVGITAEEDLIPSCWTSAGLLKMLQEYAPTVGKEFITDLGRESITDLDEVRQRVKEGMEREGSTRELVYAPQLEKRGDRIRLGAMALTSLSLLLRSAALHSRSITVAGESFHLTLKPSGTSASSYDQRNSTLSLSQEDGSALLAFFEEGKAGSHEIQSAGITLQVVKTRIKDGSGKRTVRVVG